MNKESIDEFRKSCEECTDLVLTSLLLSGQLEGWKINIITEILNDRKNKNEVSGGVTNNKVYVKTKGYVNIVFLMAVTWLTGMLGIIYVYKNIIS